MSSNCAMNSASLFWFRTKAPSAGTTNLLNPIQQLPASSVSRLDDVAKHPPRPTLWLTDSVPPRASISRLIGSGVTTNWDSGNR